MLILVAVGVMNIQAMVALTVVIFAEKILPQGLLIARCHRSKLTQPRMVEMTQPVFSA